MRTIFEPARTNPERDDQPPSDVAQVSNLPYRRFPIGRPSESPHAPDFSCVSQAGSPAIQQVGNLRYGLLLLLAFLPHSAWACAACYGQSDSRMAQSMNWGIFSLLGVIVLVLSGVAGFFVYLARRSGGSN